MSCVVWLIGWREEMLFRETLKDLKGGPMGTSLHSSRFSKCKVLHQGWGNTKHKYSLGGEQIESSPEEKLNDPAMCICSPKIQLYPGYMRRSTSGRLKEVVLPLCFSLVRLTWSTAFSSGASNIRKVWSC